jgi:hypothetical protein
MIFLNFSTKFRQIQVKQVENLLHESIDRIIDVSLQVDSDIEMLPQFLKLTKNLRNISNDLRNDVLVVNLPSQPYLAALVLAELHGWIGYFPRILRTQLRSSGLLPVHEVIEILDLQAVEDDIRD